jgi:hypothetical protein
MTSTKSLNQEIVHILVSEIRACIINNQVNVTSAMALVAKAMELAHLHLNASDGLTKKEYVIVALTELAKGKDGIAGTDDDIIPPNTLASLKLVIESNILEQTINTIWDASQGRVALQDAIAPLTTNCLTLFITGCMARNRYQTMQ